MPLEQEYVDRAYRLLDTGLADAERSMAEFRAQHRSTALAIQRALRVLKESKGTGQLVFGKMVADGETLYIGRRRVRDENADAVVVGWHAPAAQRFYDASPADPRGLALKRVFNEEERRLVRVIDEIVAASAAAATDVGALGQAFSDALLEELDRSRDGAMRDVVATIQAEQYAVIRAAMDRTVVVEGGPGTGKTVVGLHRAAWLAFNHEELRRSGVLVVAPSTTFLTYVSGVLPSLDVTDVDQVEIQRLYAGEADAVDVEDDETARIKGSAEMASVLANALDQRVGWSEDELVLNLGGDRIRIAGDDVRAMLHDVVSRGVPHNAGRDMVRARLSALVHEQHRADQQAVGRPVRASEATIRRLSAFTNAVDRMWPSFTAEELLRSLYGTQTWLVRATEGLLSADERARLFRPAQSSISDEPWTEADLFCLDEAAALLDRETVSYGHLVVDEAQDLSPMQARALARRCPSGSFTLLGDLAQSTGHWTRDSWDELTAHLARTATEIHTLSVGYRVPAPVLALAAEQLPVAGVHQSPPRSIRWGAGPPRVVGTTPQGMIDDLVGLVDSWLHNGLSVAVLVADQAYDDFWTSLPTAGVECGDGRDGDFSRRVTLVPQSKSKGLEFDAVVVVEPAAVVDESLHGARSLYVAMSRCTQALAILHARPLPAGFRSGVAPDEAGVPTTETGGAPPTRDDTAHLEELTTLLQQLSPADLDLVRQVATRLHDAPRGGAE